MGEMIMKAKEKLTFRECVYGNLMCFDGNLILIFFTISLQFTCQKVRPFDTISASPPTPPATKPPGLRPQTDT